MKPTILFLLTLTAFAEDKPRDLQAEYTKALIDFANAQSAKLALPDNIEKAKKDVEDALTKASTAAQAVLQAKSQECADKKQQVDQKKLNETGFLSCTITQEAPKK